MFFFFKVDKLFHGLQGRVKSSKKIYLIYVKLLTSGIEINIDIKYSFRVNK